MSEPAEGPARERSRPRVAALVEGYALLAAWALTCVVFGFLRPDTFMTTLNFTTPCSCRSRR